MHDPVSGPLVGPTRPPTGIAAQVAASAALGLCLMQALRLGGLGGAAGEWAVANLVFLCASALVLVHMSRSYPHDRIGACNAVTLLRAAIVCALLAPLVPPPDMAHAAGVSVAVIAAIGLALDGVDGWLARRSGLVSGFGARFDMEVDAALALVLSLHLWLGSGLGPVALMLGVMRYLFVAAGWLLPWLRGDLPEKLRRKAICVVQLAALIVLQTSLLPLHLAQAVMWLTTALVAFSFAVDVRALWQQR